MSDDVVFPLYPNVYDFKAVEKFLGSCNTYYAHRDSYIEIKIYPQKLNELMSKMMGRLEQMYLRLKI